jgi:hypothetical protein
MLVTLTLNVPGELVTYVLCVAPGIAINVDKSSFSHWYVRIPNAVESVTVPPGSIVLLLEEINGLGKGCTVIVIGFEMTAEIAWQA